MRERFSRWRSEAGAGARGEVGALGGAGGAREPVLLIAEAVGLLRSGATPAAAWAVVGIEDVDHRGVPGVGAAGAGVGAGAERGGTVWAQVRAACALAHTAGAPLADVLELVSEHAQVEREAYAAREAAIAGPRLSATVLQWLPAMGLGLGALIDVHALRVLFLTPLGWVLMLMAGALMWAGRRWMSSLVRGADNVGRGGAPAQSGGEQPLPITAWLALMDAALASGLDVRGAVAAVGEAVGGHHGSALEHVASALALGEPWARAWSDCPDELLLVESALRSAWTAGSAPRALLRATAQNARLETRLASERAIGELGVRMALPLTFCLLPAFGLVGLVPMLVAVASSTSIAW